MADSPVTRATLLLRLRDAGDSDAWSQFFDDYGPMLYRFVRSRGLQDADAADVVQEVLRRVGGAIGNLNYEQQKGGFRAWLFTITRNRLSSYFEKRNRDGPSGNDTIQLELLNQAESNQPNDLEASWEREFMRRLAARAMDTIRSEVEPGTWTAFHETAVLGRPAAEVSSETGMAVGSIYVAKSRVMAKLRKEIQRLQAEE